MNDTAKAEKYNAVVCRSCGLPIPVPDASLTRAKSREAADSAAPREHRSAKLNLRCHACEREYIYGLGDVVELPGIPWTERARASSAKLLRAHSKHARAASA